MNRGAEFSPCGLYRYRLWRIWEACAPRLVFVMLNPSTADAEKNDPTVERCERRAKAGWPGKAFGGVEVLNVFAFRATDPKHMKAAADPIGPFNDGELCRLASVAPGEGHVVVAGWGHHATHRARDARVRQMFRANNCPLYCLGLTKDKHPRHPLYVGYDVQPTIYRAAI